MLPVGRVGRVRRAVGVLAVVEDELCERSERCERAVVSGADVSVGVGGRWVEVGEG